MSSVEIGSRVRARFILNDAEIRSSRRIVLHYRVTLK
ncbi:hypothetical protein HNQ74_001270 [Bartonella doshiae]|uniref:Uncharacterized protein n=2 Tax=Bartonella doshiae TaxID=33044 RepID=A0A380ZEF3_BARDO|nr:hypothetical protein MCS_00909 [Bartonella doshiae NCTC 12862 = ATCC 700133]MBB6159830.1 hypothetical protein [Bartonella doshiae]SUV45347.1 Uncharacterised protein [Bartonella doshiae]